MRIPFTAQCFECNKIIWLWQMRTHIFMKGIKHYKCKDIHQIKQK